MPTRPSGEGRLDRGERMGSMLMQITQCSKEVEQVFTVEHQILLSTFGALHVKDAVSRRMWAPPTQHLHRAEQVAGRILT